MARWVRFRRADTGAEGFGTLLEDGGVQPHLGEIFADASPAGEALPPEMVTLLAPVRPRHFVGLWNNYHALAEKAGNAIPETPLWFLKAPGSIVGPGAPIRTPPGYAGKVLYEGELGLVIGRRVHDVDEAEADRAIFGLT
ncbi:MAG: fumarylacetoacetate hydrolase family protein, partial [Acetobacteraceae bacterium]|nr:fumarylacetoacetate hydrolase family protein [Acetobacteraceae bacterium]